MKISTRYILILLTICGLDLFFSNRVADGHCYDSATNAYLTLLSTDIQQDTTKKRAIITDSIKRDSIRLDSIKRGLIDTTKKAITDSVSIKKDSIGRFSDSLMIDTDIISDTTRNISDTMPPRDSAKVLTAKEIKQAKRDSVKYIRDSIRLSTPRLLDTYVIPDSLYFKRMLMWKHDPNFNDITLQKIDTSYNQWYTEYPFLKRENDVNSTYLGIVGSPTQAYNWFMREKLDIFPFFEPYLVYSHTPENVPFYNVKSPYTELAYWGTLLAYKDREETNVRFLTTQNLTPSLNINIFYQRFGANGLLTNEKTDNRTFLLTGNNVGKRYIMHGGYIYQKVTKQENGGIQDSYYVKDTTVESKTIKVNLSEASNLLSRNTFFIDHSVGVNMNFFRKNDSLKFGEGTMAYLGHSGEFSVYKKIYEDQINALTNDFYHDKHYINSSLSFDSLRVMNLDNKVFLRLQPWAKDAIISNIDAGAGYQLLSVYNFNPDFYLQGEKNSVYNNTYLYASASGMLKKYFAWDALGRYDMSGYYQNDFSLDAKARFSFYPWPEGMHLTAKFHLSNKTPNWFENRFYSNHHVWSNDFGKKTTSKIEGELDIPRFRMKAYFGYAITDNMTYLDELGMMRQAESPVNIISAYLRKDFKLGLFRLDNKILFQLSSDNDVLPLPLLSLDLRYYLEATIVKNALTLQFGAHALFNTDYYAPAYNPALGLWQLQTDEKIGMNPYIDIFANLQWKRASIFLKYTNALQGWPTGDYFSAYHYIRPQRAFKVGIMWPFYIK